MNINSNTMISFAEAEKDFSSIARLVSQYGAAVIMRDDKPAYLVTDFDDGEENRVATKEEVEAISRQLMIRNRWIYQELAK